MIAPPSAKNAWTPDVTLEPHAWYSTLLYRYALMPTPLNEAAYVAVGCVRIGLITVSWTCRVLAIVPTMAWSTPMTPPLVLCQTLRRNRFSVTGPQVPV